MTQNDLDIDLLYSYVDSGDTDVAAALARILAEVERQNERWERGLGKYDKMIKLAADYRDQYKIADAKRVEYKDRIAELEAENKRLSRYEGLYVARHGTDIDGNKWVYEDTEFGKQVKALQEQSDE